MRKKNANNNGLDGLAATEAAELLGVAADAEYDIWNDVRPDTLHRLCWAVGRGGGLVSLGCAGGSDTLYVSVRAGSQSKSYHFKSVDEFDLWASGVTSAWHRRWESKRTASE